MGATVAFVCDECGATYTRKGAPDNFLPAEWVAEGDQVWCDVCRHNLVGVTFVAANRQPLPGAPPPVRPADRYAIADGSLMQQGPPVAEQVPLIQSIERESVLRERLAVHEPDRARWTELDEKRRSYAFLRGQAETGFRKQGVDPATHEIGPHMVVEELAELAALDRQFASA